MEDLNDDLLADELPADDEGNPSDADDAGDKSTSDANAETDETGSEEDGDKPDAEEPDEDEGEQPKPKKLSGSARLARRMAAIEAENATLRAQVRRPPAAGDDRGVADAVEAEIGPAPKEGDYPDYLSYERALTAYETEKRIVGREIKAKAARTAETEHARTVELIEDHTDRIEALEKRLPGSQAKIAAAAKLPVADHVSSLVLDSEKSALLVLRFAEHPDELADLNRMSPLKAAKEIGRLEGRLSLPKPRTETKAPPPVRAPKGAAAPARDPSKMSMSEYERYFNARGAKKS